MRPALATHHSPYARPALAAHRGGSMRPLRPSDIRKRLPLPRTAAVIPHATVPLVANTLVALTAVTKGGLRSNGTSHMAGLVAPGLDPGATHIFSRSGRRNRLRRTPRSACRGSGRTSPIDARDVAEVIAAILVSCGRSYWQGLRANRSAVSRHGWHRGGNTPQHPLDPSHTLTCRSISGVPRN